jgi:DNA-binding transcriptional regulator YiaG
MHGEKAGYHYKESGLDDVRLHGVTIYKCEDGHKLVHIPNIEMLHDAIAYSILRKPPLLTAQEFRFLRKWVGLTMSELAKELGVSRMTIHRCENEKDYIMRPHDHMLRMLAAKRKEDSCKRQMYVQIAFEELFAKIANKHSKPAKITIDVENLPKHPSQASQESQLQLAGI